MCTACSPDASASTSSSHPRCKPPGSTPSSPRPVLLTLAIRSFQWQLGLRLWAAVKTKSSDTAIGAGSGVGHSPETTPHARRTWARVPRCGYDVVVAAAAAGRRAPGPGARRPRLRPRMEASRTSGVHTSALHRSGLPHGRAAFSPSRGSHPPLPHMPDAATSYNVQI
uniref:Uncharacterized protein n=1 Tax=Arundo donax TaxID=35708 RepID=A0A0A9G511_ARUDO